MAEQTKGKSDLFSAIGSLVGLMASGGNPMGAALGGGLGSLMAGGSLDDALQSGIGGLLSGNAGPNMTSLFNPNYRDSRPRPDSSKQNVLQNVLAGAVGGNMRGGPGPLMGGIAGAAADPSVKGLNMGNNMSPLMYGVFSEMMRQQQRPRFENLMSELELRQYETGERRPDYKGYVLPETPRRQAGASGGVRPQLAQGGYIQGPGTGTSDSIPAKIYQNGGPVQEAAMSDGEFVMTEAAVRGAGRGNPDQGAANMYRMMNALEQRA
jgi:hypothetical protein